MVVARFGSVWLLLVVAGCGARTGLDLDEAMDAETPRLDAGRPDAGRRDGGRRDAGRPDAFVPPDVGPGDGGPSDAGPPDAGPPDAGPDTGPPPCVCRDAVACTRDFCDDARVCMHEPDPDLCPISHRCDPVRGCQARALAHWGGDLHEVDLPAGINRFLATAPTTLTDLALAPDRTLYGVDFTNSVLRVDETTGATTPVVTITGATGLNGLDAAPDGVLYASAGDGVHRIDIATGALRRVATLPTGFVSSGDLAFLDRRLVATVHRRGADPRTAPDSLAEVDLAAGTSRIVGNIGLPCVWGLAAFGPTLYGLTCTGIVAQIDPTTGTGRTITRSTIEYWGATAR